MRKICIIFCSALFIFGSATMPVFAAANPINPPAVSAASAAPGAPTPEYLQAIKAMQENKFNENDIKSFVYQVFSLFDRHADFSQLSVLFSEDDLQMRVPEKKIESQQDLADWYAKIGSTYQSNLHIVEKLIVTIPSKGEYRVNLTVLWQALGRDGKFTSQRMNQQWTFVDGSGYWPRITKYVAQPAQ